MNIGIDPGGRAFRWQAGQKAVQTAFAVLGCPPYKTPSGATDQDEKISWEDPKAFRPQVSVKQFDIADGDHPRAVSTADLITVEDLWRAMVQNKDHWQNARSIVDAVKAHCPPRSDYHLAFAIPNRLTEDAQDAFLRALGSSYRDTSLLWRPIAIMLHWLDQGDGKEVFRAGGSENAVWVLDLDSAGLECTRLTWRRHKIDEEWVAPVRTCATENERRGGTRDTALATAWSEIFHSIPEREQLRRCQTASDIQRALESAQTAFYVWVCSRNRWRRAPVEKPQALTRTWQTVHRELGTHLALQTPQTGDVMLVHGWLACFDRQGVEKMLRDRYPGVMVRLQPVDAVAEGARFFAERRAAKLPTYYDTLPEYEIWTSEGPKKLIDTNHEVEPGTPWRLTDDAIRNAFCINRHRDVFSMLVRRIPCDDPETDYARRLRVGLNKLLPNDLPLQIDATVEAAKGNARFTATTADGASLFVSDGKQGAKAVTLTYALDPDDHSQGKQTQPEPEHKGYLEAQPVIGRIYDDPANEEMLRLLVRCWNKDHDAYKALGDAVRHYRLYNKAWKTLADVTLDALDRWGWHVVPKQPTRGLFGTRSLPNRAISELANTLAALLCPKGHIPHGMTERNKWSKRNNFLHGNASQAYKDHIRTLLRGKNAFPSWAEAHASGFVLGDHRDDLGLLVDYCARVRFGNPKQSTMFCWSVFRMLCWHTEIVVTPAIIRVYLDALVAQLPHFDLHDQYDVPRKNVLFSILFALRVREKNPEFLDDETEPLCARLLQLTDHGGCLCGVRFPQTMVAHMAGAPGTFSDYVARFIRKKDTVADRELGSSIGTMQ